MYVSVYHFMPGSSICVSLCAYVCICICLAACTCPLMQVLLTSNLVLCVTPTDAPASVENIHTACLNDITQYTFGA